MAKKKIDNQELNSDNLVRKISTIRDDTYDLFIKKNINATVRIWFIEAIATCGNHYSYKKQREELNEMLDNLTTLVADIKEMTEVQIQEFESIVLPLITTMRDTYKENKNSEEYASLREAMFNTIFLTYGTAEFKKKAATIKTQQDIIEAFKATK